jgi:hypothetical protein
MPSSAEEYVEEACFYLSEQHIRPEEIAEHFSLDKDQVEQAIASFRKKLRKGLVKYDDNSKEFWSKNLTESKGDLKITLVDDKGRYYHGWKSELEKMDTDKLVQLLLVNKQYSDSHPLAEFTKGDTIIGYDPMVPLRNIRKTVSLIEGILEKKDDSAS